MKYAGADWIEKDLGIKDMSPLGKASADFLGDIFLGIYHIEGRALRKVDWRNNYNICIVMYAGGFSTVDSDVLTRMVVLAHDRMLRVDICPRSFYYLQLIISQRKSRVGELSERCPTLEDHVDAIRKAYAK